MRNETDKRIIDNPHNTLYCEQNLNIHPQVKSRFQSKELFLKTPRCTALPSTETNLVLTVILTL